MSSLKAVYLVNKPLKVVHKWRHDLRRGGYIFLWQCDAVNIYVTSLMDDPKYIFILPFDISERFPWCDVIDDDDPVSSSVIGRSDCPKPFLSGCVPNLKLHPVQNMDNDVSWEEAISIDYWFGETRSRCKHESSAKINTRPFIVSYSFVLNPKIVKNYHESINLYIHRKPKWIF